MESKDKYKDPGRRCACSLSLKCAYSRKRMAFGKIGRD